MGQGAGQREDAGRREGGEGLETKTNTHYIKYTYVK